MKANLIASNSGMPTEAGRSLPCCLGSEVMCPGLARKGGEDPMCGTRERKRGKEKEKKGRKKKRVAGERTANEEVVETSKEESVTRDLRAAQRHNSLALLVPRFAETANLCGCSKYQTL